MARPKKSEQTRDTRADLVNAALKMFLTDGYESVTVNALVEATGLSKGTFYHHFPTKSDLLDAVVEILTVQGWRAPSEALKSREGTALDRLNRMISANRGARKEALPNTATIVRAVYQPENMALRDRMWDRRMEMAAPAVADCLRDGIAEGVMKIDDADAAARLLLVMTAAFSDEIIRHIMAFQGSDEKLLDTIMAWNAALMRSLEALVGTPSGSLLGPDKELMAKMISSLRGVVPPGK